MHLAFNLFGPANPLAWSRVCKILFLAAWIRGRADLAAWRGIVGACRALVVGKFPDRLTDGLLQFPIVLPDMIICHKSTLPGRCAARPVTTALARAPCGMRTNTYTNNRPGRLTHRH